MDITSQFIELVKISSPSGKEGLMSVYLQNWLTTHDFTFQIDTVGNILAKNNANGEPLLLCAHMDTVQPGENINPIVKDGVITSDGKTILGADNKAFIASLLCALETTTNNRAIELLFTVKEETGGGVEFFQFDLIQSKKSLIFDSANPLGGIVLRSPFITNFDLQFTGISTHSSKPDTGINAFMPAFEAMVQIPVGNLDAGETTVNIGLIKGGAGINIVPNLIQIQGEVRSYSELLFNKHIQNIKTIAHTQAKKTGAGVDFKLSGFCAGYTHEKDALFIESISEVFTKLNINTTFFMHSGISDANVLNAQGIETVNLTDGIKKPHTTEEQVAVIDLQLLCEIIKKCITEL